MVIAHCLIVMKIMRCVYCETRAGTPLMESYHSFPSMNNVKEQSSKANDHITSTFTLPIWANRN